jgi:hypothetical protein
MLTMTRVALLGQSGTAASVPAVALPPSIAAQVKALAVDATTTSGGAFVPASDGSLWWTKHKSKVLVGGAVVGAGLLVYLLAK